jgi:quercetin dioxygenase-like cupin family protein
MNALLSTSIVSRRGLRPVHHVLGVAVEVLSEGAETGGVSAAYQVTCAPGAGAPPHRHAAQDEAFFALAGEFDLLVGDTVHRLQPGDFIFVPRGEAHAFTYAGTTGEGRLLGFCTPAGHEAFFREAGAMAAAGPFDPTAAAALCARHGIELLIGPPAGN